MKSILYLFGLGFAVNKTWFDEEDYNPAIAGILAFLIILIFYVLLVDDYADVDDCDGDGDGDGDGDCAAKITTFAATIVAAIAMAAALWMFWNDDRAIRFAWIKPLLFGVLAVCWGLQAVVYW